MTSGMPHKIIPVNPEMIMIAHEKPEFKQVLNKASLVLPDGIGVVMASRILGKPIKQRVTGVDTVKQIVRLAKDNGWRIFLLGAAEGVAELARAQFDKEFPGVQIVGTYAGSPNEDERENILKIIKVTKPDILFVAYGAPKQEMWVEQNFLALKVPLVMCVGGTFDFVCGLKPRAPSWMQSIGLEWLYRLKREPWRWKRMLALPRFAFRVILEKFRIKSEPEIENI
jgi:N-acetylglucosaminyldiphosphoundecaprenol N-acetyl-beta-D-mannosaminyltransferase